MEIHFTLLDMNSYSGGGFKYFWFFTYIRGEANLMGWKHQLDMFVHVFFFPSNCVFLNIRRTMVWGCTSLNQAKVFIFCFKMIPVSALVVLLVCSPIAAEAFVCTGYTGWYWWYTWYLHIRNIMILEHGVRKKCVQIFFEWLFRGIHTVTCPSADMLLLFKCVPPSQRCPTMAGTTRRPGIDGCWKDMDGLDTAIIVRSCHFQGQKMMEVFWYIGIQIVWYLVFA